MTPSAAAASTMTRRPRPSAWRCLLLLTSCTLLLALTSASNPSSVTGMILRVRLEDGTMERIQIPPGQESILSIKQAVSKVTSNMEGLSILFGSSPISDDSMTLTELGLKHGSLVTLHHQKSSTSSSSSLKQKKQGAKTITKKSDRWDPFPELAKDYESAKRHTARRRSAGSGMSYGDLAKLQSSLHTVEPQPTGPFQRVYMCRKSAERFQASCLSQKTQSYHNRVGLLLGNISRERVDAAMPKARTSLSSTTDEQNYCQVVKVHAVWEPPQQKRHHYDSDALLSIPPLISAHARRVADWLGLSPVGWIFSYDDNRNEDQDALPVYQSDIQEAAVLQIHNMNNVGREEGCRFATLAMDARTGATEAFQLSDVCVQMVAEGMIVGNDDAQEKTKKQDGRYCKTKHAILVDGKETQQLDSVLCLVNTAMLSHEGSFAGSTAGSSVKKNGSLTNKARKAVLKAMDDDSQDASVLELLCDFSILLALDEVLDEKDSERLCKTVQKWARGQKKGTKLDDALKLRLKSILQ